MNQQELKRRTKLFALKVIQLVEKLPSTPTAKVIGRQLLRSGTSPGANYRSACRARSRLDFISKMGIVEEEIDETMYWLELLIEAGVMTPDSLDELMKEADELLAIIVTSIRTAKRNK